MNGIGDEYHSKTKYHRDKLRGLAGFAGQAEPFKVYENPLARIKLPDAELPQKSSLWRALLKRRSRRNFSLKPLPFAELVRLLFAIQGVTKVAGGYLMRTAPSAGALYPIETYLLVNQVEGLDPGVYHLNVLDNCLELLVDKDLTDKLTHAAMDQQMLSRAAVNFIWTAIPGRSKWKYRERAYRYIYMDAGHICANLYLAAEDLRLGCCGVGAFFDDEINAIIGVDGEKESVVYLAAVGIPR